MREDVDCLSWQELYALIWKDCKSLNEPMQFPYRDKPCTAKLPAIMNHYT